ncbi:MAG: hypothetical protein K0R59_80 [Sphingobacterium sp.]|nr:hypothetical protein [Sphingobacterium sp.]
MIEILPYSLVRYASLPIDTFAAFQLDDLTKRLQLRQRLDEEQSLLRTTICDALYQLVQTAPSDADRINLIRLKRMIYNNKIIDQQLLGNCSTLFSAQLHLQLSKLLDLMTAIAIAEASEEDYYQQHLRKSHRRLQQLADHHLLKKGLLLSSPILLSQLPDYIQKDPKDFGQKEWRLIFSLLRYLTRMTFKTSPFSSFTYTGLMQLCATKRKPATSDTTRIRSGVRLNNGLFEYLKSIMRRHDVINEFLTVRLNSTARIQEDKLSFLFNHNNIEAFQKLPATGLQRYIFEQLRTDGHSSSTFGTLIDSLESLVTDADRKQIKQHLVALVDTGFLELSANISAMDHNWNQALQHFLKETRSDHPDVRLLVQLLDSLLAIQKAYPEADIQTRKALLEATEREVNSLLKQLSIEQDPQITTPSDTFPTLNSFKRTSPGPIYFAGRQLLYEDCYTEAVDILAHQPISQFVEKTDELLRHLRPMDAMAPERAKMLSFFKQHYPVQARVNLLDFYFDYYSTVKKQEKEAATVQSPASNLWIETLDLRLKEVINPNEAVLQIDANFFGPMLPGDYDGKHPSYARGIFVQFCPATEGRAASDDTAIGVINAVLPGMGKVSGRFLHLFPSAISDRIRANNERLHPTVLKAELSDGSFFNANIHPPLLFHECNLSEEYRHYPAEGQIPVHELTVSNLEGNDFLSLWYQQQEVFAYDLCLESFYNRSNFYQLLAHFNSDEKVYLQPFINRIDQHYLPPTDASQPIIVLPRIVYGGTVVIRRKTWCVRRDYIPLPSSAELASQYFLRLNNWRVDAGIPPAAFLFLRKRSFVLEEVVAAKTSKQFLPDDYKPQYISFEQPILVDLFSRLLARAGDYLVLEEVLPLASANGQQGEDQVKEYLIQWYNY